MASSKIKPLSAWMAERNSAYYQSASTSIYGDFMTYAQSPKGLLTRANARAFHAWALLHPQDKYSVLEAGVGEGAFALGFLQELAEADRENCTQISSMLSYALADFSKPLLQKAKDCLSSEGFAGQIEIIEWDASHPAAINGPLAVGAPPAYGPASAVRGDSLPVNSAPANSEPAFSNLFFDLIRCNELFCDLPADVYARSGDELMAIHYDSYLQPHQVPVPWEALERAEQELVRALPADYHLPFNRAARSALLFLSSHLTDEGSFDVFDYGFYRADDFALPSEFWNLSLVREYNSQWTVDVNFLYLSSALSQAKFKTKVEPQAVYADIYRPLCSMPPVSKKSKKEGKGKKKGAGKEGKGKKEGLDYGDEMEDGVEEDDFFYHLEVRK